MPQQVSRWIEIAAPTDTVWSVMADVERWSEWTESVTKVQRLEAGPLVVGSTARIEQPGVAAATWQVQSIEPGHRFVWSTGNALVRAFGDHRVEPDVTGEGAVATLVLTFTGPLAWPVARWYSDLNERYLDYEAQGLKRRSESLARR